MLGAWACAPGWDSVGYDVLGVDVSPSYVEPLYVEEDQQSNTKSGGIF